MDYDYDGIRDEDMEYIMQCSIMDDDEDTSPCVFPPKLENYEGNVTSSIEEFENPAMLPVGTQNINPALLSEQVIKDRSSILLSHNNSMRSCVAVEAECIHPNPVLMHQNVVGGMSNVDMVDTYPICDASVSTAPPHSTVVDAVPNEIVAIDSNDTNLSVLQSTELQRDTEQVIDVPKLTEREIAFDAKIRTLHQEISVLKQQTVVVACSSIGQEASTPVSVPIKSLPPTDSNVDVGSVPIESNKASYHDELQNNVINENSSQSQVLLDFVSGGEEDLNPQNNLSLHPVENSTNMKKEKTVEVIKEAFVSRDDEFAVDEFDIPLSLYVKTGSKGKKIYESLPSATKFSNVWKELEEVGWFWLRGKGLVSFIYSRPFVFETSSTKRIESVMNGSMENTDYFSSEDGVLLFLRRNIDAKVRLHGGNDGNTSNKKRRDSGVKEVLNLSEGTTAVGGGTGGLKKRRKSMNESNLLVDNEGGGKDDGDDIDEEVSGEHWKLHIKDMAWKDVWFYLLEEGWKWTFGNGMEVSRWYHCPKDITSNKSQKFSCEADVCQYVYTQYALKAGIAAGFGLANKQSNSVKGKARKHSKTLSESKSTCYSPPITHKLPITYNYSPSTVVTSSSSEKPSPDCWKVINGTPINFASSHLFANYRFVLTAICTRNEFRYM